MISAETTSRGISFSRPRWVNRDMNSSQIKLGSFSENSNAASLALSIKDSAGPNERVDTESAGGYAAGGGVGPLSLAEADESAPGDELPPETGMAMENLPIGFVGSQRNLPSINQK